MQQIRANTILCKWKKRSNIQAGRCNGNLETFEELGRKEAASVKALAAYDELSERTDGPT